MTFGHRPIPSTECRRDNRMRHSSDTYSSAPIDQRQHGRSGRAVRCIYGRPRICPQDRRGFPLSGLADQLVQSLPCCGVFLKISGQRAMRGQQTAYNLPATSPDGPRNSQQDRLRRRCYIRLRGKPHKARPVVKGRIGRHRVLGLGSFWGVILQSTDLSGNGDVTTFGSI